MTANEPESISKYFLRPGRIDQRWLIDHPDQETVELCMDRFSMNGNADHILAGAKLNHWSMARVQQELLAMTDDSIIGEVIEDPPYEPKMIVHSESVPPPGGQGDDSASEVSRAP